MKPEDVPADLYDLALDALPGEPDEVISATTQEEVRAALAAVIPEIEKRGQDWTRDTPDGQLAMARLACGHAKIVLANVGVPGPGSSTRCDPCGSAVAALRYIAGGGVPVTGMPSGRPSEPRAPHRPPGGVLMEPSEVPADLLDLAHDARLRAVFDGIGSLGPMLAAVLPEHERRVREQVAAEIRETARSLREDGQISQDGWRGYTAAAYIARGEPR